MKTDPRTLKPRFICHALAGTLPSTPANSTYEFEHVASDGKILVRVKGIAGKPDAFRWTTQDELTD